MTSQLELFNGPTARRSDPPTSAEAAASLPPLGGLEALILSQFRTQGGLTDDELAGLLPELHGPTVRTCRSRLYKRGLLVASSARRPSSRGRDQVVWRESTAAVLERTNALVDHGPPQCGECGQTGGVAVDRPAGTDEPFLCYPCRGFDVKGRP